MNRNGILLLARKNKCHKIFARISYCRLNIHETSAKLKERIDSLVKSQTLDRIKAHRIRRDYQFSDEGKGLKGQVMVKDESNIEPVIPAHGPF